MSQIKKNKHQVYTFLADHPEWFEKGIFLSCQVIGQKINKQLAKDCSGDPPFIKLSGSTLTAMVYDGVLEREYNDFEKCFFYRPVLPIKEEYKSS